MKKRIKKWGNSIGILFNKDDCDIFGLKEGQLIEIKITQLDWDEMNKRVDVEIEKEVKEKYGN